MRNKIGIPLRHDPHSGVGFAARISNGRKTMKLSRRDVAAAGALALGASALLGTSSAKADSPDMMVKDNVEALRMALLKADKAKLEALTADQLSYSHSDGRVEDKAKFINGVMTRKAVVKSIEWP